MRDGDRPQLTVRDLEDEVVRALHRKAALNGRSAEAEHRSILRTALLGERRPSLKEHLSAMPCGGEDGDFERRRDDRLPGER